MKRSFISLAFAVSLILPFVGGAAAKPSFSQRAAAPAARTTAGQVEHGGKLGVYAQLGQQQMSDQGRMRRMMKKRRMMGEQGMTGRKGMMQRSGMGEGTGQEQRRAACKEEAQRMYRPSNAQASRGASIDRDSVQAAVRQCMQR